MTHSSVASIGLARPSVRVARADAAFFGIAAFLVLEPLVRSLVWWAAPIGDSVQLFHADTNWLILAVIGLLAGSLSQTGELARRHPWLVRLAPVWGVAAVISSALAVEPALAAYRSLWWGLGLVFALCLLMALRGRPARAHPVLMGWCLGFCAYALVLAVFIAVDPVRSEAVWTSGLPGVANVRHLGFEAMAAGLIGSLYRPTQTEQYQIWLLRLAGIAGWAVLFWSGGRGSFLAACAAFAVVLVATRAWARPRFLIELAALFGVGFTLATLHAPPSVSLGAWRTLGVSTMTAAASGADLNSVTSLRWEIWREAAVVIAANPLFGVGEAQAPLRLATVGKIGVAQPHNLFLQAGLAWGVIGGAAFVVAIGYGLYRAARRLGGTEIGSPAIAGLAVALAMAANSMLDGTLFHPRPVMMFLLGLCLALGAPASSRERR